MTSSEEFKALATALNLGARIEKAKETGTGLCHCGIFSSEIEDYILDADDADEKDDEKDESESK